jgi:hypothetical protein
MHCSLASGLSISNFPEVFELTIGHPYIGHAWYSSSFHLLGLHKNRSLEKHSLEQAKPQQCPRLAQMKISRKPSRRSFAWLVTLAIKPRLSAPGVHHVLVVLARDMSAFTASQNRPEDPRAPGTRAKQTSLLKKHLPVKSLRLKRAAPGRETPIPTSIAGT